MNATAHPSRFARRHPTRGMNALTKTLLCLIATHSLAWAAPVTLGDTTGNTRGADAIDIQSYRDDLSQIAAGDESLALGTYNTALGNWSMAIGSGNLVATSSSGAFGMDNIVSAANAFAFGAGITNTTANSLMFGPSNTAKVTILSSGDVILSGNISKAGGGTLLLPASGTLTLPANGGTLVSNTGTQTITGNTTIQGATTLGGSTAAQQLKVDTAGKVAIGGAPIVTTTGGITSTGKFSVSTSSTQSGRYVVMGDGDGAGTLLTVRGDDNGVSHIKLQNLAQAQANHGFGIWTYFGTTTSAAPIPAGTLNIVKETDWYSDPVSSQNAAMTFSLAAGGSAPAEKMRISSNGNVGIGTPAAGAKLQVAGNAVFGVAANVHGTNSVTFRADSDSPSAELFSLNFQRSNYAPGGTAAAIVFAREGGAYEGNFSIKTNNGTSLAERMRIAANGNVGIGTTAAPAAKLEVNGNFKVSGGGILTGNGSGLTDLNAGQLTTGTLLDTVLPSTLAGKTLSGATLTGATAITGSVTVGGADVLTTATDLNAAKLTGTIPAGILPATSLPVEVVQRDAVQTLSGKTLTGAKLEGTTLIGGSTAADQVAVSATGNVGIGTAAPAAGTKLDVSGAVQVTGNITVRNVGDTKSVIFISPVGDIDMGDFTAGTNPNPSL